MIQIPIEIGDTILAGRFKNKKITVREIGLDDFGLPTINGRGILKIRIPKLYVKENTMKKINEGSAGSIPVKIKLLDIWPMAIKALSYDWGNGVDVETLNFVKSLKFPTEGYILRGETPGTILVGFDPYQKPNGNYVYQNVLNIGLFKTGIPKFDDKSRYAKMSKNENKLNEGSTDSIPVKIKKEDGRYFIYVQYPDETEKCITNVGFETEDLALHSVTTKGYTLVNDKNDPKANKFTEPPKAMTQRSNEFKLSEASLKTLKRLIVEVLNEVDVTDPKVEAAIDELSTIEEQLNNAIAQVEALKKQLGIAALEKRQKQIVDEQLWDFLEEMKKDGERVARTKNVLMNLDREQSHKVTYSYEQVYKYAMTQVNQDVKFKILQELKATEKISRVKPSLSFTRTAENKLNEANVFQRVGDWIAKTVKSLLGGLKTKGQKIDSDLTKLERILKIV